MNPIKNKIDFAVLITVNHANPNGDPLNGNRPRMTSDGYGHISDVCIKRKIRNRLQNMGEKIFVQMDELCDDNCKSLKERAEKEIGSNKKIEDFYKEACEKWIDVRAFGQVFAYGKSKSKSKGEGESDDKGVSVGVRGPVSIQQSFSVSPIDAESFQITKSVSGDTPKNGAGKGKDTMGMKHMVDFGLYVIRGAVNVQLAEKTNFDDEDANKIKEALRTLFVNDSSSARPEGSMEVAKLYWWKHNNKIGQYSSAAIQLSLKIRQKNPEVQPKSIDDYEIKLDNLEGITPEIIDGI